MGGLPRAARENNYERTATESAERTGGRSVGPVTRRKSRDETRSRLQVTRRDETRDRLEMRLKILTENLSKKENKCFKFRCFAKIKRPKNLC